MSQFTKREVTDYYKGRINNQKLTSGQRNYAKKRFSELLNVGSLKIKKPIRLKGSTTFVKKKRVTTPSNFKNSKVLNDSIIYYDSVSKETRKLGRSLTPAELKHLKRKSKYFNSFDINERLST